MNARLGLYAQLCLRMDARPAHQLIKDRDAELLRETAAELRKGNTNWSDDTAATTVDEVADWLDVQADKTARAELDTEFPATKAGGHALIVEYGDEELYGSCQCGTPFNPIRPSQSIDKFAELWERHVMTEVAR